MSSGKEIVPRFYQSFLCQVALQELAVQVFDDYFVVLAVRLRRSRSAIDHAHFRAVNFFRM